MSELSFAEKLRMEQQAKNDPLGENLGIVNDIVRAVKELTREANKKGRNNINGYIWISCGYDPGDFIPQISGKKQKMKWVKTSNCYDVDDLTRRTGQKIKELGFTNFKVNITKEKHIDYESVINWLGMTKTKKTKGEGEDYFVWVDISW